MLRITGKMDLNSIDFYMEIEAPHVARKWKPGNFVILMLHEKGERIPESVYSVRDGRIGMFIRRHGKTTLELYHRFKVGDYIYAVSGPHGREFPIKHYGTVIYASDAVCGHAENASFTQELKKYDNYVISIQTFETGKEVYPEEFLAEKHADEHYVTTLDGSAGVKGHYTDLISKIISERRVDLVLTGGSLAGMFRASELTKRHGIPNYALVRTIMVDGTGMCGSCRVFYGGAVRFACVDGPVMNAHLIDWEDVMRRDKRFIEEQEKAKNLFLSKIIAR